MTDLERRQLRNCRIEASYIRSDRLILTLDRELTSATIGIVAEVNINHVKSSSKRSTTNSDGVTRRMRGDELDHEHLS